MDRFFEEIFGKEHHEARAEKFASSVREIAKKFPDLEIVVSNITNEEIDLGAETELAAQLDGDEKLADWIKRDNEKTEAGSASETVIGVTTSGDNHGKITQVVQLYDSLARKYNGSRQSGTGTSIENGTRKLPFLKPDKEDLPAWTNVAIYEFRDLPKR